MIYLLPLSSGTLHEVKLCVIKILALVHDLALEWNATCLALFLHIVLIILKCIDLLRRLIIVFPLPLRRICWSIGVIQAHLLVAEDGDLLLWYLLVWRGLSHLLGFHLLLVKQLLFL